MCPLTDLTCMSGARPIDVHVTYGHAYVHVSISIRMVEMRFLFSCEEGEETNNLIDTQKLCG
jgi:hypothetical protein